MKTLNVIIPYFNEANRLAAMLRELAAETKANNLFSDQTVLRFFWCNDGSTDSSLTEITRLLKELNAEFQGKLRVSHELVNLEKNSGKAAAMRAGFLKLNTLTKKNPRVSTCSFLGRRW